MGTVHLLEIYQLADGSNVIYNESGPLCRKERSGQRYFVWDESDPLILRPENSPDIAGQAETDIEVPKSDLKKYMDVWVKTPIKKRSKENLNWFRHTSAYSVARVTRRLAEA